MNELRTWYRERLPARIAALESAREELDRSGADALGSIRRIAHMLRGSGGTYGFPEVSDSARQLEEAAPENLRSALAGLIGTLQEVVQVAFYAKDEKMILMGTVHVCSWLDSRSKDS